MRDALDKLLDDFMDKSDLVDNEVMKHLLLNSRTFKFEDSLITECITAADDHFCEIKDELVENQPTTVDETDAFLKKFGQQVGLNLPFNNVFIRSDAHYMLADLPAGIMYTQYDCDRFGITQSEPLTLIAFFATMDTPLTKPLFVPIICNKDGRILTAVPSTLDFTILLYEITARLFNLLPDHETSIEPPEYKKYRIGKNRKVVTRDISATIIIRIGTTTTKRAEPGSRNIDWSCHWQVRGHWRKLHDPDALGYGPDGEKNIVGKTWIKPALKGPLDKPFKNRSYIVTQ